jgi:2-methylcitrate dehydratase PrpD
MTASLPPLLPHATRDLARFAAGTRFTDIPATVIDRVKLSILDGLGVCLHGSTLPWTQMVRDMVIEDGGKPLASVWNSGAKVGLTGAVLVNSTAGHAFEMDDIHKESILHPNSLSVPTALALAEADPTLSGRDIVTAIAIGAEIGIRIGNAATMALFLNGFHPQGTSGAFVAAVTAGHLLKLSAEQMQHAIGIAGSLGAGLMAAQEGAMVKRLHAGRAAQGGMTAALLARKGFTGISDVVEAGYGGFLSAIARTPNPARLLDGLGSDWEVAKVGFKMYPNVTSIHAALDATRAAIAEERLRPRDIQAIEIGCGHMTFVHTAWDYRPAGVTAAQMNMFYGIAVMALRGDVAARDYTETTIADPETLSFIPCIKVFVDDALEAMGPAYRHAARVTVRTADGRAIAREVLNRRGSPENPVTREDVERKFAANLTDLLDRAEIDRLKSCALSLDTLANADDILGIVGPARSSRQILDA